MEKKAAANSLRKLAGQLESVAVTTTEAAALLESIGVLEQVEADAKARADSLKAKITTALAEFAAAREEKKKIETEAVQMKVDAELDAREIVAAAEESARQTKEQAEKQAEDVKTSATKRAADLQAAEKVKLDRLSAERQDVADALATVSGNLAVKTAELAEVTAKIDQAKSSLRQFVGA